MASISRTIAITGANGNIGQKLAGHLLAGTTTLKGEVAKWHVKMLDDYTGFCQGVYNDPTPSSGATGSLEFVQAQMTEQGDWCDAFAGVDSVMHLQAWNPYPEATWEDSRLSMDITNNAIAAAQQHGVRRFIYSSSNHVFGRYWREGATLSESGKPIDTETLPNPGTQFRVPSFDCDATPYAAAKLAGECALKAATLSTPGFSGCAARHRCRCRRRRPSAHTHCLVAYNAHWDQCHRHLAAVTRSTHNSAAVLCGRRVESRCASAGASPARTCPIQCPQQAHRPSRTMRRMHQETATVKLPWVLMTSTRSYRGSRTW